MSFVALEPSWLTTYIRRPSISPAALLGPLRDPLALVSTVPEPEQMIFLLLAHLHQFKEKFPGSDAITGLFFLFFRLMAKA